MPCLEAHHSVGAGLCSAPTRSRKTVKFIKISAAPSIDGNRSTATSCKFGTPVSGGAYQDARKVSLVWNDAQNIGSCLNSEAGRTKRNQASLFFHIFSGKTEKIWPPEATSSCKFAATSQSALLTAPLGGEPFCGGMEPRGILRRLRRLRADWIFFLILRKAQNCGVDTPRNPVGRTRGFLAPLSAAMQKRHPKWDGVFAWWS